MKTFLVADPHFGHAGVCKFLDHNGNKLRPWTDPEAMNEDLTHLWNKTVGEGDKVYVLGDVVINRRYLPILDRLNGDKVLIKGNHDIFKLPDYTKYFRDIRAYHVLDNFLLSHIPVHPDSLGRFKMNIHGHLHSNVVNRNGEPDIRYFCVSVEQINYRPIDFEDIRRYYKLHFGKD